MSDSRAGDRLLTERCVLRRFGDADRAPFARINADEQVTRFLSGPMAPDESDALVDRIVAHWDRWGYGLFAVECGDPGRFVGFVGLSHHRALPDDVEIGWRLDRAVWGRGIATECARAVVGVGFGALGLDALVSITTDVNLASRRVMAKLGFRYVRHVEFERWSLRVAELRPEWL
jgi:RimJ/RimL family protein N-acetyltransferase